MPTNNSKNGGGIMLLFLLCLAIFASPQTVSNAGPLFSPIRINVSNISSPLDSDLSISWSGLNGQRLLSDDEYFEAVVEELSADLKHSSEQTILAIQNINKELSL